MVRERSRRRLSLLTTAVAMSVLGLVAAPAMADMYRWVDAKGVVNYSNIPPPADANAKRIAETEPTVSVIPPPEKNAEQLQAAREAALLRRIEQLEDELAALRTTAAAAATYPYPVPAPEVTYGVPVVYPYAVWSWPIVKPGRGHGSFKPGRPGFKPRHPGFGSFGGPGARPAGVMPPRSGATVRARF